MKVLVTAVGSATGITVMSALARIPKSIIIGTDILNSDDIAGSTFCDRFYKVPKAMEERVYITTILEIVRSEKIDMIIPCTDIEAEIISKHHTMFSKEVFLCMPPYEATKICSDKLETFRFFEYIGMPTPKTMIGKREYFLEFKFPLIVKPRRGVGSSGVYEINTLEELCLMDRIEDPIMQEKLEGKEFTVDILANRGKMIICSPRWRLEVRDGKSYKCVTFDDPNLHVLCNEIVYKLKLNGIVCIQGFLCEDGSLSFTKINPRPAATMEATTMRGFNLPYLVDNMANKELMDITEYKNIKLIRYWDSVVYDI